MTELFCLFFVVVFVSKKHLLTEIIFEEKHQLSHELKHSDKNVMRVRSFVCVVFFCLVVVVVLVLVLVVLVLVSSTGIV